MCVLCFCGRGDHDKFKDVFQSPGVTQVGAFVNADTSREIVFTRGATEAINLVAQTWGLDNINEGDEIVTTVMEHHSNMVPWQVQRKDSHGLIYCIVNSNNIMETPLTQWG